MTINVETDHPHGVAHVALFTCQHALRGDAPSDYRSNLPRDQNIPRRLRSGTRTAPRYGAPGGGHRTAAATGHAGP
jgi:hypothetical protein